MIGNRPLRGAFAHSTIPILFALFVGLAMNFPGSVSAAPNDGVEDLNEEQQAIAARFLTFLSDMDAKYFGRASQIDSDLKIESKEFNYDFADYLVKVGRGPVVEKIGRMTGIVLKPTSDIQKPTVFGRYYGIDIHPKTPLVGLLHAAFIFQYHPDGKSVLGGWVDILPGATSEEDLAALKKSMDDVFEKHGIDGTKYRERVCEGLYMAVERSYVRRPACVGGTFFGRDMFSVTEENYLFMTEMYESFIDTYVSLIEKRKDQPYTPEDVAAQDAMRLNWFEDQVFADPYAASGITPYEVWSLAFTPPVVKF